MPTATHVPFTKLKVHNCFSKFKYFFKARQWKLKRDYRVDNVIMKCVCTIVTLILEGLKLSISQVAAKGIFLTMVIFCTLAEWDEASTKQQKSAIINCSRTGSAQTHRYTQSNFRNVYTEHSVPWVCYCLTQFTRLAVQVLLLQAHDSLLLCDIYFFIMYLDS